MPQLDHPRARYTPRQRGLYAMMMDERTSRIFFGLCMLVLVWIGVYWMWQPSREQDPVITFEPPPSRPEQTDPAPSESENAAASPPIIAQIQATPAPTPAPAPGPRLIPPEFTEHIVRKDERMQTIAQAYYGSINDWPVIAKANPSVDPQKLYEGIVLRIPKDKNNIQGIVLGATTRPGVIESRTPTESRVIEYVVRPGDSLSVIAQRIYGSSRHARFIYDSNRDILKSMDSISVGQLLKLPPLPAGTDQPGT